MPDSGIVAGVMLAAWLVRELVPVIRARNGRTVRPPAEPPERLATAAELETVRLEVHGLREAVARLDERLGPVMRYFERETSR